MALRDELHPASYKDIPFLVNTTSLTGGRKHAKHEFPNSNIQNIEDLGLKPREYKISAIINEPNYRAKRDALLRALDSEGSGVLIHPFYGRIENMAAVDYTLIEDVGILGDLTIQIDFKPSNSDGLPVETENTLSIIEESGTSVFDNITADIGNLFNVTNAFTGNYRDAQDKLNSFVLAVTGNTKTLTSLTGASNDFNQLVSNFQSSINTNINQPLLLAQGMSDIFAALPGLYDSAQSQFSVQSLFFTFGDDDVAIPQTTAGRIERQENRDLINNAVKGYALSQAYTSSAAIDFQTVSEIEEVESTLEVAFQSVKDSAVLS